MKENPAETKNMKDTTHLIKCSLCHNNCNEAIRVENTIEVSFWCLPCLAKKLKDLEIQKSKDGDQWPKY